MAYNNKPKYNKGYNGNKGKKPVATVVKDFYNPYAFVPFADCAYSLTDEEKKELDSIHEIPVKGSLSGRLKVDFRAENPFCVRKSDGKNLNIDGQYYVPGSSIKGMVRSVFEILTLANARNGVENNRYSMRDLRSDDYELKNEKSAAESGFLLKINGKYYVQRCNSERKHYNDIKAYNLKEARTIEEKYKAVKSTCIYQGGQKYMWMFSGFMNNKRHEYLFEIPLFSESELIPLVDPELTDFLFIHEKENENKNWKFWKKRLKNFTSLDDVNEGGIAPCFFRVNDETNTVRDLGFSYLYRQPYSKTIHQFLPDGHKQDEMDLSQAVFGYVKGKNALKGRVQFGNAFIENAKVLSEQKFVLGSPKPTFYPFYLEQKQTGKLSTYFGESRLSGAKRYIIHGVQEGVNNNNRNVSTSFFPLDRGTTFTTYVNFHNLHDYELGALIAAITFCGRTDCYHSLGYAKPFGFGKLKVESCSLEHISAIDPRSETDMDKLLDAFIQKVTSQCSINKEQWQSYVEKLFQIASTDLAANKVRYPIMGKKFENEFNAIKNNKYSLADFTPR